MLAIEADVRKLSDCKRMVSTVSDKFGALHGLVNNAGITGPHGVKIEDYDFEAAGCDGYGCDRHISRDEIRYSCHYQKRRRGSGEFISL